MQPYIAQAGQGERFVFPGAIELEIIIPSAATSGAFAVFEDIVEPGVGPARHVHQIQDETFFIQSGTFDIEIDGVRHSLKEGDVAFVPSGTVHAFKNTGNQKGRLRYTFSPAAEVEAMFRAFYEAEKAGVLSEETMKRIALRHGQEFVGPPL